MKIPTTEILLTSGANQNAVQPTAPPEQQYKSFCATINKINPQSKTQK